MRRHAIASPSSTLVVGPSGAPSVEGEGAVREGEIWSVGAWAKAWCSAVVLTKGVVPEAEKGVFKGMVDSTSTRS